MAGDRRIKGNRVLAETTLISLTMIGMNELIFVRAIKSSDCHSICCVLDLFSTEIYYDYSHVSFTVTEGSSLRCGLCPLPVKLKHGLAAVRK